MTTQLGLPFQRHSDTSRQAAIDMLPKAGTKRRQVLDGIECAGDYGATDEELQSALRMSGNTERPRRVELMDAHLIKDSGRRRQTLSGEQAVVWVISKEKTPADTGAN